MILNPRQIYLMRLGKPIVPCNFGGDSDSTTQTTTQNYDNRTVTTNTTSNLDLSNRAVDSSVKNTTTTINNLDGGAIDAMKSVANGSMGAMKDVALGGLQYGDSLFDTATLFANNALNSSLQASASAYSTASSLQKDALLGARDAFASATKATSDAYKNSDTSTKSAYATALDGAAAAYADAKGTTNSQKSIIMGVLVVAGIMALAIMQKRG